MQPSTGHLLQPLAIACQAFQQVVLIKLLDSALWKELLYDSRNLCGYTDCSIHA